MLVPVNWTNNSLEHSNLKYSDLDKLSISNIPVGSKRYASSWRVRKIKMILSRFRSGKTSLSCSSYLQIMDTPGSCLCHYFLDLFCPKKGVRESCINETSFYCIRTSASGSVYCKNLNYVHTIQI